MPREARKKSETNIYHVILRGINRQVIFEDDGDRHYFMSLMKYCKELSDFKLYAFCLMGNHVHLLLETGKEPLGLIFKRIGSRYVAWYNRKYQRTGHLFQDRFRSEAVEDGQYFMTVLRYILQNPMKAGMENCPGSWRWSSYLAYEKGNGSITDTEYAIGLFEGRDQLLNYVKLGNEDAVMDEERFDWRLRDERAKEIVERVSGCATVAEFQGLEKGGFMPGLRRSRRPRCFSRRVTLSMIRETWRSGEGDEELAARSGGGAAGVRFAVPGGSGRGVLQRGGETRGLGAAGSAEGYVL